MFFLEWDVICLRLGKLEMVFLIGFVMICLIFLGLMFG